MQPERLRAEVVRSYTEHINPYLAKLMNFAGFGVEVKGEGCYLFDQDGKKYLDCLGGYGVFSLGHRHPKVVEAVRRQLDELPLSGKTFFSKNQADLAEKLAEITPDGLQFSFFSNSGTESVEAALKFAKATTGRSKIVSTEGGYHGKTVGALSPTGRAKYRERFEPLMPGVDFVPYGDSAAAAKLIDGDTAAVIVEPVQGEGGMVVPPAGYLNDLRDACSGVGALLIVDEVQTGLGRTGKMFGCDHDAVSPDIMTLAKALGGGVMPIGATVFTQGVCDSVFSENPLIHTSTFGGNPLACAAALAAIEVVEAEGLAERAEKLGDRIKSGLADLKDRFDIVSDVRGMGLMIGVEFGMDEVGELTISQIVKRGMIAAYTLNNPRVIRIEPPLTITEEQADWAVVTMGEAIAETQEILAALT
ncbi:MAG: aspartate aminotransferase family protein [Armatimonadetes bacterium]|nr:aspartate aminotransferase family protein [Armatimonadota bacterium]